MGQTQRTAFPAKTGQSCSMEQLLDSYYRDGGRKIRGLVDQIFFSKYGGTAGRDMDEFYSVANEVFADIVRHGRYDPSRGEFNAFLYKALCFALSDELKRRRCGRRMAPAGNVSLDASVGEEETTAGELIPSDFHMEEVLGVYFGQAGDDRVEKYLGSLSGTQRRIVEMRMEGVPVGEVVRRLQLTRREYRSYMSSARRNENISLFAKRTDRHTEGCGMNEMIPIDVTDNYRMDKCPLGSLLDDMKDGKLNRKYILQRKPYQWTQRQKNKFLTRVLNGQPVPEIVICEQMVNGKKKSHLIDGLQRLSYSELYRGDGDVIRPEGAEFYEIPYREYLYDQEGNVVLDEDGDAKSELKVFNVIGKKFSELPDFLKARFNKFNVNVTTFFNCSDEQIAYHIRNYNNQEGMNKNQYEFTGMSVDMAENIKSISDRHPFFTENMGRYTEKNKTKGDIDRIVVESIMTMYFLEDWKKKPQDSYDYVNRHGTEEMFRNLRDSLDRLCSIMDRDMKDVFTTTNSAVWFAVFDRFKALEAPVGRFREFVLYFKGALEELQVGGRSFAEVYRSKNTRDRAVVQNKIHGLTALMQEFLQENDSLERRGICEGKEAPGTGIAEDTVILEGTGPRAENIPSEGAKAREYLGCCLEKGEVEEEDLELFALIADDVAQGIKEPDSPLLREEYRPVMVALAGYAVRRDEDDAFKDWIGELRLGPSGGMESFDGMREFLRLKEAFDACLEGRSPL